MHLAVQETGGGFVGWRIGGWIDRCEVKRNANARLSIPISAQDRYCQAVCQQKMMCGLPCQARVLQARSVDAVLVSFKSCDSRFIEREPVMNAITKMTRNDINIFGEGLRCVTARPASLGILKYLR